MRSIGSIAALALLAACGSAQPDNALGLGAESTAPRSGEDNAAPAEAAPANEAAGPVADSQAGSISPCLVQGTDRLKVESIRAAGTEPFWAARVEGRCVTYSTPEDQQGVRVWTRYSQGPDGRGTWVGELGGKKFELRTRPEPGCSDGMSDKSYPIAVELVVNGEDRRGCAAPL